MTSSRSPIVVSIGMRGCRAASVASPGSAPACTNDAMCTTEAKRSGAMRASCTAIAPPCEKPSRCTREKRRSSPSSHASTAPAASSMSAWSWLSTGENSNHAKPPP